jgi:hypothetical protein
MPEKVAQDLTLNDLVESLMLHRGRGSSIPGRDPALIAAGNRQADPLEIAVFDALQNIVATARARKFSEPGGPNETGMPRRRFPMHALERESDPLNEIMQLKASELQKRFHAEQGRSRMVRYRQGQGR